MQVLLSQRHTTARGVRRYLIGLALCAMTAAPARALTPLQSLSYVPDITVVLGGSTFTPQVIVQDNLAGTRVPLSIGTLPPGVHINAYHREADGSQLLAFDTTVKLTDQLTAKPADVVRFDGSTYTIVFDAAANGIPPGVMTDAVSMIGSNLLLSFDTTVVLNGRAVADEDVVNFDGSIAFDGSIEGVPAELDLDGLAYLDNGHLLVSFDGGGVVGGVNFRDEDILEYDGATGTWELAYDARANDPRWAAADLVALDAQGVEPTATPTATATETSTATATPTSTLTASATPPPSETATTTPVVEEATATPTETSAATATPTATPTASATPPPSETATPTETATTTPVTEEATATPTASPTGPPLCVGDCDGSTDVSRADLLLGVNIALGNVASSECAPLDTDGTAPVTITQLVRAIGNALTSCPTE